MTTPTTSTEHGDRPDRVIFYVGEKVYCVVGFDLRLVQSEFESRIDPDFFGSTAEVLVRRLARRRLSERSAMLLRMSYLHALETALALTFAAVQAPSAVPAWLRLYRVEDLDRISSKVLSGQPIESGWVRQPTGCREIVAQLMDCMPDPLTASSGAIVSRDSCIQGFTHTLTHMMREFLDQPTRQEYNDLKHGFRVTPGGFRLAFRDEAGTAQERDARPATLLADSEFGSSSWALEAVSGAKHIVRYVQYSRNWDPVSTAQRMHIVAAWIANVKAGLALAHGGSGPAVKWQWIAELKGYEQPWTPGQPTRSMSWRVGDFEMSNPPTPHDLAAEHQRAREAAAPRGA